MARDIRTRDIGPMLSALLRMHRAASYGADATVLTVPQLRDIIDQVHLNFNVAKTLWLALVALVGPAEARNALARILAPTPADIDAALASIQSDALALLSAYESSVYGTGSPAWSYSASLSAGLVVGGHTEAQITAPVLAAVNTFCVSLRDSLIVLADID